MKKNIKIVAILIILLINITNILSFYFKISQAIDQTTSSDINYINSSEYPGIKELIQSLQEEHPNWNFKILYTGIDWGEAVTYEYTGHRKFS